MGLWNRTVEDNVRLCGIDHLTQIRADLGRVEIELFLAGLGAFGIEIDHADKFKIGMGGGIA